MKNLTALFFALILTIASAAQVNESLNQKEPHHIGITGGFTTGVGLSYRYWPSKFGIQATALPIFFSDNQGESGNFLSLGLTPLYTLKEKKNSRLFVYASGHFINNFVRNELVGDPNFLRDTSFQLSRLNIGSGAGIDVRLFGMADLRYNFMVGFGVYNLASSYRDVRPIGFLPTVESSIFYRF